MARCLFPQRQSRPALSPRAAARVGVPSSGGHGVRHTRTSPWWRSAVARILPPSVHLLQRPCVGIGFGNRPLRRKPCARKTTIRPMRLVRIQSSPASQDRISRRSDSCPIALCACACRGLQRKEPPHCSGGSVLGWGRQRFLLPPPHGSSMTSVSCLLVLSEKCLPLLRTPADSTKTVLYYLYL
jgi:hypothetical protein